MGNDTKNLVSVLNYDLDQYRSLLKSIEKGDEKAHEVLLKKLFLDSLKSFESAVKELKSFLEDSKWNVFESIISEVRENYQKGLNYTLLETVWKLNPLLFALEQLVNRDAENPFYLFIANSHYKIIKECIIQSVERKLGNL